MSLSASACAKIILLGEHAVVYGRPAVALPLPEIRARAEFIQESSPFTLDAPQIGVNARLDELSPNNAMVQVLRIVSSRLGGSLPAGRLRVLSDIPVAAGLGSGAAVTTAIVRVLAAALDRPLTPQQISDIVFEGERVFHGTPSGIDNTVIGLERPVLFVSGSPPEALALGGSFDFVVADSGDRCETRVAVESVRQSWWRDPPGMEKLFDEVGECVGLAVEALRVGSLADLGRLMNRNQELLQAIGVSTPLLGRLVAAARDAGALGAKLSGAGMGGSMIALAPPGGSPAIVQSVRAGGAAWVRTATVHP
jgi:mevalonate kinase